MIINVLWALILNKENYVYSNDKVHLALKKDLNLIKNRPKHYHMVSPYYKDFW